MEQLLEAIKKNSDVRNNLIELRRRLKEPGQMEKFLSLLEPMEVCFQRLLRQEDPKVRKNAALLIGDLQQEDLLMDLYQAYENEATLFVRSSYLKAMLKIDVTPVLDGLKRRQEAMERQEPGQEEQKHYREELSLLRQVLSQYQKKEVHAFTGFGEAYDVVLTTNPMQREITARQIKKGQTALWPFGLRVRGGDLKELQKIRTYQELLFVLRLSRVEEDPVRAAESLASSGLWQLLQKAHKRAEQFYFRITIVGPMTLEERSNYCKKCSFALEGLMGKRLRNDPSDYEIEIRLMERRDGTFLPLVKLHTLKDTRFSYRKYSLPVSIKPSGAALVAALASPWMKKGGQVLDPFCGVGTMLIERDKAKEAGPMYGIDTFGEAIKGARENTYLAGKEINYIHRDFFDFTHGYLFDEIITNMPVRGKRTKEEQEAFYRNFFRKAKEVLKPNGIMVLHSNEKGYIRKEIRLQEAWKLINEYNLDEKEGISVYIIGRKDGHHNEDRA